MTFVVRGIPSYAPGSTEAFCSSSFLTVSVPLSVEGSAQMGALVNTVSVNLEAGLLNA